MHCLLQSTVCLWDVWLNKSRHFTSKAELHIQCTSVAISSLSRANILFRLLYNFLSHTLCSVFCKWLSVNHIGRKAELTQIGGLPDLHCYNPSYCGVEWWKSMWCCCYQWSFLDWKHATQLNKNVFIHCDKQQLVYTLAIFRMER